MAHDQLRLNLIHSIHRHTHHNQQRRAAEIESHVQPVQQKTRKVRVDEVADARQMLKRDAADHDLLSVRIF